MASPEEQLSYYRAETERLTARYNELRSSLSYRIAAPIRIIERAVNSSRKRSSGENARRVLGGLLQRIGVRGPSGDMGHWPQPSRGPTIADESADPANGNAVPHVDRPPDAMAGIEEQLYQYRRQIAGLSARCDSIRSTFSYRISSPIRFIERAVKSARKRPPRENARRAVEDLRRWLAVRGLQDGSWDYHNWIRRNGTMGDDDDAPIRADIARFPQQPLISIFVLPSGHPPDETWRSLQTQIYARFEILTLPELAAPASLPVRLIAAHEQGSADLFNAALALAKGSFCLCLASGDVLARHALYQFARESIEEPDADLIYGDEDERLVRGIRLNPFFKPDWNSELAHAFDYIGRAAIFRTSRLLELDGARPKAGIAWRWDMCSRLAFSAGASKRAPAHIQDIVLHRNSSAADSAYDEASAFKPLLQDILAESGRVSHVSADRRGWLVVTPAFPPTPPRVAIVIPSKDKVGLLSRCIASIFERTRYPSYGIYVVDNRSVEKATFDYYDSISNDPRVTIVSDTAPFNYAAIHNRVVPQTQGDVLALLNNDIEIESPSWLDTMTAFALQPDIGLVGAKLHFPDNRIQHAGVIVDDSFRLLHCFRGEPRDVPGPRGLIQISREVQAVTGACMVMRRSVFDEVGGFDEAFAVSLNDIDLCLRITQRGYRIVLAANSELFHVESATRGKAHERIHEVELNLFRARWESRVAMDARFRRGATGVDTDAAIRLNRDPLKLWARHPGREA